jgi:hypothetical protein
VFHLNNNNNKILSTGFTEENSFGKLESIYF